MNNFTMMIDEAKGHIFAVLRCNTCHNLILSQATKGATLEIDVDDINDAAYRHVCETR